MKKKNRLTPLQKRFLDFVRKHPEAGETVLLKGLGFRHRRSIWAIVERLEAKGFIKRRRMKFTPWKVIS